MSVRKFSRSKFISVSYKFVDLKSRGDVVALLHEILGNSGCFWLIAPLSLVGGPNPFGLSWLESGVPLG